jgi:hypothetical protein
LLWHVFPDAHCASAVQLVGHVAAAPLHRYGVHDGLPALPAVAFVHVPSDPATLHASHAFPHALLQQYPSTQFPLVHWPAAVQVLPFAFFATQLVPLQ